MPTALLRSGDRPLVNLGLLVATVGTTFLTFLVMFTGWGGWAAPLRAEHVREALAFSLTLVAILGSHEMGHYVYARIHQVDTSLPYFIPVPLIGPGTLGAVIRIRGRIPTRNALVDIGAAGPLAGLAVAVPLLLYGFAHSTVADAPGVPSHFPGDMSLWHVAGEVVAWARHLGSGALSASEPRHVSLMFGDNLLLMGMERLFFGALPEGKTVVAHPMVVAGWFGLLVTMLNLVPIGQLDGGHVAFALFGPRARYLGWASALALLGLCVFASYTWLLWLLLSSLVVGFRHPAVVVPEEPLSRGRKIVSALCLLAFIACLMPVPFQQVSLP